MSQVIKFTVECQRDDCDGTASSETLFLDANPPEPIEIDLEMSTTQLTLTCETCGYKHYTGDIEVLNEDDV